MPSPISHHRALGIHPGAFVQPAAPNTADVQDGVLWLDTSSGPPYQLKRWDASGAAWRTVQMDGSGYPLPQGHRIEGAAHDPLGAQVDYTSSLTLSDLESERLLPGADVQLAGYQGHIHVFFVIDLTIHAPGGPSNWTVRVRRTNLLGEALRTGVLNDPSGSTIDPVEYAGSFIDTVPTDGRYVLTIQNTGTAGYSIESRRRYLRLEEVEGGERLRLVHATAGLQVEMPFPAATGAPAAFLGRDPASGLPAWSAVPSPARQYVAAIGAAPASADTCTRTKCGATHKLVNNLLNWYAWFQNVVGGLLNALGATFATMVIGWSAAVIDLLTEGAGLVLSAEESALLEVVLKALPGITGAALAAAIPSLNSDAQEWVRHRCFCALVCEGGQVALDERQMQAWQSAVAQAPDGVFINMQRDVLAGILQWGASVGLLGWAEQCSAGATNLVSDCDAYTCP